MKITFLGTGTSHGVPLIGCKCKTCNSKDPHNIRYRSSLYIETDDQTNILIDTPPELRIQLLKFNIVKIDAVLFTHPHADHLLGFDDIRSINKILGKHIPCYGNNFTIDEIKHVFKYIFHAKQKGGGLPQVELNIIKDKFKVRDIEIIPLKVKHGKLNILGYRINRLAYITDSSYIPDETLEQIKDVDLLILEALRHRPHKTHYTLQQALELSEKLEIPRVYLTHIAHDLEHNETNKKLPDNIQLAYDGLSIEL